MSTNTTLDVGSILGVIVVCGICWFFYSDYKEREQRQQQRLQIEIENQKRASEEYNKQQNEIEARRREIEDKERLARIELDKAHQQAQLELEKQRLEEIKKQEEQRLLQEKMKQEELQRMIAEKKETDEENAVKKALVKELNARTKIKSSEVEMGELVKKHSKSEDNLRAFKNRFTGTTKRIIDLNNELRTLQKEHGRSSDGRAGTKVLINKEEAIKKALHELFEAEAERKECISGMNKSTADMSQIKKEMGNQQVIIDTSVATLKEMNLPITLAPKPKEVPPPEKKEILLKSGQKITGVIVIQSDDEYVVKDDTGNVFEVKKSKVEKVEP